MTFLNENPDLAKNLKLEVSGYDLLAFGNRLIQDAMDQGRLNALNKVEDYLTPEQFSKILQISLVTLWSWDKKGITIPLRIGNKKLYRRSDLEKILN